MGLVLFLVDKCGLYCIGCNTLAPVSPRAGQMRRKLVPIGALVGYFYRQRGQAGGSDVGMGGGLTDHHPEKPSNRALSIGMAVSVEAPACCASSRHLHPVVLIPGYAIL